MAVKNVVIVLQIVDTDITCTTNEKLKKGEEISCMSTSICFTDLQQSYNREELTSNSCSLNMVKRLSGTSSLSPKDEILLFYKLHLQ